MARFKLGALILSVAVALGAIVAATASGFPEFKPSTKQLFRNPGVHFSGTGTLVNCSTDTNVGEITGASTVGKVVLTFKGCASVEGSKGCTVKSSGAGSGEIITHTIKGELGEVAKSEAESEIGLILEPETGTEFTVLEGTCLPISPSVLVGDVIGEVSQKGGPSKSAYLNFETASGKARISKLTVKSGSRGATLKGLDGLTPASIEAATGMEFQEKEIEIT